MSVIGDFNRINSMIKKIQISLNLGRQLDVYTTLLLHLADDVAVASKSYITELTLLPCSFS